MPHAWAVTGANFKLKLKVTGGATDGDLPSTRCFSRSPQVPQILQGPLREVKKSVSLLSFFGLGGGRQEGAPRRREGEKWDRDGTIGSLTLDPWHLLHSELARTFFLFSSFHRSPAQMQEGGTFDG